jgi:quinol monooxygenase YgiN
MRRVFPALLAAVVVGLPAGTSGQQASSTALHVVSYVEVAPGAERAATGLLRQYRDASRRDHGSLRMDVLQQSGRPDHFVVLESWQDKDAWTAHGAAAHTKQFAAELPLQLVSPVDRQLFNSLAIAAGSATDDAVYVVTHVDTIPSPQSDAPGLLKRLADDSRKDDGSPIRRPAGDRKNHFTVVGRGESARPGRARRPCAAMPRQLQPLREARSTSACSPS